jgi:hypothetical protein
MWAPAQEPTAGGGAPERCRCFLKLVLSFVERIRDFDSYFKFDTGLTAHVPLASTALD